MDPFVILEKYYYTNTKTYHYLVTHSKMVAAKALEVASRVKHLNPDTEFIEQAALLHDVGIYRVNAHRIGCIGPMEYVCHGYLGREMLEQEGYPRHAMVCERHVGLGISVADIEKHDLPLPKREMVPETIEEQIICYADKFFTKFPTKLEEELPIERVRKVVAKYGEEQVERFEKWHAMFGG